MSRTKTFTFTMWILILCIVVHSGKAEPDFPIWNDRYCQDFTETFKYPVVGSRNSTGKMCYDWNTKRYALYRDARNWDHWCNGDWYHIFRKRSCTQYVDNGYRYLYYPEEDYCCMWCTAAQGCDVLKPDWVNGAEFLGEIEFNGDSAYKWNQKGLTDNLYYETVEYLPQERVMLGIDMDIQVKYFNKDSYTTDFDPSYLQLPNKCDPNKKCSLLSFCKLFEYL